MKPPRARAWPPTGDRSSVAEALAVEPALHFREVVPGATVQGWVRGVRRARAAWTRDFGGEQFSLGRAWYTHLEQDRSREYFAGAAASDAAVEAACPGLQAGMRALASTLLGARVEGRHGWCGAGVHVFPAAGVVARRGGVVHFDSEGLAARHLDHRRPAVTLLLMLQAPERGGGLRLWDRLWDGEDHLELEPPRTRPALVHYAPGELLAMSSYRLHQIEPFGGRTPRISATLHLAELDPGRWEAWF